MMRFIALAGAAVVLAGSGPVSRSNSLSPDVQARFAAARGPVKLWVYFKDKGSAESIAAAIAKLPSTYDAHAVARRAARRELPGLFDEHDLPVVPAYAALVSRTGASFHIESRWLNAISVYATKDQAAAIASLPCVRSVEPVVGGRRDIRPGATEQPEGLISPPHTDDFYGIASAQLNQINVAALHSQGFTGAGIRVGILDTGFKRTHVAFNNPAHPLQVIAEHDFVKNDGNTAPEPGDDPDQHTHGTLILGTLGAYKPNEMVGGAYDAAFILCKTEDITSETPVEEDNYVAGLEFIESHGGDVATASLIYADWYTYSQFNGLTAPTTIAVNLATSNGLYCCNAVGNSGHDANPTTGHIAGVPADAFKVLSIGAVEGDGSISGFSSDGPTADGRLKPEILARGGGTSTVAPWDDLGYTGASGTSLSTPLAAGAVACLAQARPWWSVDQMRTRLMTTASDFIANGQPDPTFVRGYGIINAAAALAADCYSNCDNSTTAPVLNALDFGCFLSQFAAGSAFANCDNSTTAPILNALDFGCFLSKYAAGCP